MPATRCPQCDTPVDVHTDDLGFHVVCPQCSMAFPTDRPAAETPTESPKSEPSAMAVRCTACKEKIEVVGEDIGHKVECPHCGEHFLAGAEPAGLPRYSDRRPPGRRRSTRDDDDDDYYYYRDRYDRRRERRYLNANRVRILAEAKKAVYWPAQGLMWTGAIFTALSVLIGLAFAVAAIYHATKNSPGTGIFAVYAVFFGGFGSVYHLLIAVAGFKMKQLRSKGWAYAAGIVGIASVALVGLCSPSTWAAVTFGIMALVAISKREVQDAILLNTMNAEED